MKLALELQNVSDLVVPAATRIRRWAKAVLDGRRERAELSIRIVGEAEGAELNRRYRHKSGATNVLSFPCDTAAGVEPDILGDLVICAPVVEREAHEQEKNGEAHWAHMVVHGTLHLLGHDHVKQEEAERMEALETEILARLGYPDPYQHPKGKAA